MAAKTEQPTVVALQSDNTIQLPAEIAQHFEPDVRFALLWQGDTLILKRVGTPRVSDIVGADDEEGMSLDEISDIVHEVRTQRSK